MGILKKSMKKIFSTSSYWWKQRNNEKIWRTVEQSKGSKTNNLKEYDEKYMKTKFSSDNNFPLKKTLELSNIEIEKKKFYCFKSHTFLEHVDLEQHISI